MAESPLQEVLDRLRDDGERLFGGQDLRFTVVHTADREASKVLKVAVAGAHGVDTIFVKFFKPREPGPAGRDFMNTRVLRDFDTMSRAHGALATLPGYAVVRP